MQNRFASTSLMLLALVSPATSADAVVGGDGAREEFLFSWDRVASFSPPANDSPKLRRYVLYPWLEGARIRDQLGRVSPPSRDGALEHQAMQFLDRMGDQPVANGVWQTMLGYYGRRAAWREFLVMRARYPDRGFPTDNLRCFEFSAKLAAQQTKGLRDAVVEQWLTSGKTTDPCGPIYSWIDSPDQLSVAEIEQRARYTGKQGLPRPASFASLPESRRKALDWLKQVDVSPTNAVKDFMARAPAPVGDELRTAEVVNAFERVSRNDSSRAKPIFEKLSADTRFSASQRAQLRRHYALGLAYDRDPDAVGQFEKLILSDADEKAHEWRLRSALWNGEWRLVQRWLAELPADQARTPRWLYWSGRMHQRRGEGGRAREAWEAAAKEREYYAFLSAEQLGRPPELRHRPLPEDWPTLDLLSSTPALRRAKELLDCNLPVQAGQEFNHALRSLPANSMPQAVRLASNWGWHDRAVRLQSQLKLWDDLWLRFPLPYDGEIDAAARETRLPADWLYAVLRTESLYNPRAVSHAGAMGLLQLMPKTATAVARRAGMKHPGGEELFRPEINIALGARYLREMTDRFSGRLILTLAAYNAGPHRVTQWLPWRSVDGDIWVENIPYNETRTYVQRGLSSLAMIGWRRTGEPAAILPLLDAVSAKLEEGS